MSSSQDKSLPATEQRLRQVRKDGQAARSRDLSHIAILGMGAVAVLMLMPYLIEHLQRAMSRQLTFNAETVHASGSMLTRLSEMALIGLAACVAFALLTSAAAIGSAIASGGWIYNPRVVAAGGWARRGLWQWQGGP